jgi:DNA-binding CsgD family transcriptional regulator
MQKKDPLNIEKVRSELGKLEFDENLHEYKADLLKEIDPENIFVLKNQFYFITDCQNFNNVYVHPNIICILGYEPEFFRSVNNIYNIIHPDDHDFVLAFSKKTILYSRELYYKPALIKDPRSFTCSIDFRMKKKDGCYSRLNKLSSSMVLDKKGNLVYSISIFTDISHMMHKQYVSCSWTGDESGGFHIDDIRREYVSRKFSPREVETIKFLAEGFEGKEIALKLNISEHTVISHRKSIIRKAMVNNSAELVKYAIEFGII